MSTAEHRPTRLTTAGKAYLDLRRAAKATNRDTGELLQLFALEGFLVRLVSSPFAGQLVLKGGVLLAAFDARRPTRDIDISAADIPGEPPAVLRLIRSIAAIEHDDGLVFDDSAARATTIRDDGEYGGVRVTMPCSLARARMRFYVDVNIGDPVWPLPGPVQLPCLLGGSLTLLGYPLSMVFAEKIVTTVQRGDANTRWRDFADIYLLNRRHDHDGTELSEAIRRVAESRKAVLGPLGSSLAGFSAIGQSKWALWRHRQRLDDRLPEAFAETLDRVIAFADPALDGSAEGRTWSHVAGSWTS